MNTLSKVAFGTVLLATVGGVAPALSAAAATVPSATEVGPFTSAPATQQPDPPAGSTDPVGDSEAPASPGPSPSAGATLPTPEPTTPPSVSAPQDPAPSSATQSPLPSPQPTTPSMSPTSQADLTPASPKAAFVPLAVTSHAARDVYVTGLTTLAGEGTPGGKIVATNQWGTVMGTTVVDEDGDWRILRNLGPTTPSYIITFVQTAGGRTDSRQIELVYVATNVPVTVTSHDDGDVYETGVNTFTGTGTIGATLTATNQWGTVMGLTRIGADGTWSFKRNLGGTDPGYVIAFTSSKGAEIRSTTITLVFPQLVPVTVTSPDISAGTIDHADEHVVFTGTGTPFATLTGVNQWGTPFGEAKVDKNGHWEFRRWVAASTHYDVTFTQVDAAGKTLVSPPFSFTSPAL